MEFCVILSTKNAQIWNSFNGGDCWLGERKSLYLGQQHLLATLQQFFINNRCKIIYSVLLLKTAINDAQQKRSFDVVEPAFCFEE
jgi:hypothetical protein